MSNKCHICGKEVRENYYLDSRGYTCYTCSKAIANEKSRIKHIKRSVGAVFETPGMKVVKLNCEHMKNHGMLPKHNFHNEFLEKTAKTFVEAENKFIQEFAEKEGLSLKCAEYLLRKHYRFRVETFPPKKMFETARFALVLEPIPIEEVWNDDAETSSQLDNECEKELLKKGDV